MNCTFCHTNLSKIGEGNYGDYGPEPYSYYYHCIPCGTEYTTQLEYKRVEKSPYDWYYTKEITKEYISYFEMKNGWYRAQFYYNPPSCQIWYDCAKGRCREIAHFYYHPHITPQNFANKAKTMQVFS